MSAIHTAPARLSDLAYDRLRRAVMDGQVPPGARLAEQELCRSLEVGRTPLREALWRLEGDGLIENVPNAGFRVRDLSVVELEETFMIRSALECLAAQIACIRGFSDLKLDDMEEQNLAMEAAAKRGDARRAAYCDFEFHSLLVRLPESGRLEMAIRSSSLPIFFCKQVHCAEAAFDGASIGEVAKGHREIVLGLRRRDSEAATAAIEKHLSDARGHAIDVLRDSRRKEVAVRMERIGFLSSRDVESRDG